MDKKVQFAVNSLEWWNFFSIVRVHRKKNWKVFLQLLTATSASEGIERILTFNIVHSKLNRLGIQRAAKLVVFETLVDGGHDDNPRSAAESRSATA